MINCRNFIISLFIFLLFLIFNLQAQHGDISIARFSWSELPALPSALGTVENANVIGAFVGISNEALIFAGGVSNIQSGKDICEKYQQQIYILTKRQIGANDDKTAPAFEWMRTNDLAHPIAFGSSAMAAGGVICLGGKKNQETIADVFLLKWNPQTKKISQQYLPSLPKASSFGSAAVIDNVIYFAGGQSGKSADTVMKNFWSLDLAQRPDYQMMTEENLVNLAKMRGIHLNEIEKGKINDQHAEKNRKDKLITKLLSSDEQAARFFSLDKTRLMKLAQQRKIAIDTTADNEQIIKTLMNAHWGEFIWQELPTWPGPARAENIAVSQHNGETNCVYVIGGRNATRDESGDYAVQWLTDVYEFNPIKYRLEMGKKSSKENPWRVRAKNPSGAQCGTGIAVGQSHLYLLSSEPGFTPIIPDSSKSCASFSSTRCWLYHTITDTWIDAGEFPPGSTNAQAVYWDDSIFLLTGEINFQNGLLKIWRAHLASAKRNFGWLNFATLFIYLAAMVGIGAYFTRKNKNTNDYFRGGQKIPWWAAGCSIYATMLSSITYMSIPAIVYATDCIYILGYPAILTTAAIVVFFVLPFFRQIDATSAYEYLEKRFNRATRLIGSALFILFQIGRMAIVMFLSALALAAITPFSEVECILLMGILSLIYCTLGGIEAVIWTDTAQTFVLLGGALLILVLVLFRIDGGIGEFFDVALAQGKFHMIDWDWKWDSYTRTAFWLIILGSLGQNLVSYTSDQAVVQRYMTTSTQNKAARAIWLNAFLCFPTWLLFFSLGAALFVFYQSHPTHLDPTFKTDAIMPLFIVQEVPDGLGGLIVAGIFAAAQSTISTSMNSTATALITDFIKPFHLVKSEKVYLNLSRLMTVVMGTAGTGFALLFSSADIKSLFESFITVIGLFGGSLAGLFLLGMFTRRANGVGAVLGAFTGALVLYLVKTYTATHLYLYAFVGILTCFIVGYVTSLLFPVSSRSIVGLTIFTINKTQD